MNGRLEAGVLLVDKPAGKTSFSVVRDVRRVSGIKKVGHAGTLDPFATGLLVVAIGRPATRLISAFMEGEKEYVATLKLGWESTTLDPEGELSATGSFQTISAGQLNEVLDRFRGDVLQTPPSYSALKYKGKPLYHYARKGIMIEKEPRQIEISRLEWLDYRKQIEEDGPSITLRVTCSKGTYIRTLAADIGKALGCGAYLSSLRRTRSGFFSVEQGVTGDALTDGGGMDMIKDAILNVEQVQKMLQYSAGADNVPCSR